VALGVRYISHNHIKQVNIDGARMSKIFARTLPAHMITCIDFYENDHDDNHKKPEISPMEKVNMVYIKNSYTGVFLGNDMRPVGFDDDTSIEILIELNTKHQLLTTLENNQVSMVTKMNQCEQFNKNKQSYTANLLGGGLTNDFYFDLFS
jgi:hypothetical protein